ncbi:MAG: sporulation integral membrane protein YtvI [Alistipes sp.]|nr:sporulation integral membrane protein YtvI [Alistipes sp.]
MGEQIDKIEKRRRFIINVLYWGIIGAIVLLALRVSEPVLGPLVISFIIAWILARPIAWISEKIHLKKPVVALVIVLLFYIVIGTAISRLFMHVYAYARNFVITFPQVYETHIAPALESFFNWVEETWGKFDPSFREMFEEKSDDILTSLGGIVSEISSGTITAVSGAAASIPKILMKILITLVLTVFMTMDIHNIVTFWSRQIPEKSKNIFMEVKGYLKGTVFKCLKSYLMIMCITFVEVTIGFLILGVKNAPLAAAGVAVIDILPILGTGTVVIPWAVISLIRKDFFMAAGLVILYVVVLVIRQVIEPKIVGTQLVLHPVVTLCGMFVGLSFGGIIGMFAVPIAFSCIINLNDRGVIHILK